MRTFLTNATRLDRPKNSGFADFLDLKPAVAKEPPGEFCREYSDSLNRMSSIGRLIALYFARAGADVAIIHLPEEEPVRESDPETVAERYGQLLGNRWKVLSGEDLESALDFVRMEETRGKQ